MQLVHKIIHSLLLYYLTGSLGSQSLQLKLTMPPRKKKMLHVPFFVSGPGFLSTSPAISSKESMTPATFTHTEVLPSTHPFSPMTRMIEQAPNLFSLGQRNFPHPPLFFRKAALLRKVCSKINDRATTAKQPWSTIGVLFITSPTPHLAAPGRWKSLLHMTRTGW